MELPNFPFENFQLLEYYFLSNFQYASKFSHTFNNFLLNFVDMKIEICRTIILPVVLYGCVTWSIALREERGPRVL